MVELPQRSLHHSNAGREDNKAPQLRECKMEVLFCLVAQEAPALLRQLMDQTVNTSNSAMLECQVHGIPEPQITWFKNHEEIQQESGESSDLVQSFCCVL